MKSTIQKLSCIVGTALSLATFVVLGTGCSSETLIKATPATAESTTPDAGESGPAKPGASDVERPRNADGGTRAEGEPPPRKPSAWKALSLETSIGQITSLWGSSASDVWFVAGRSSGSSLLHYDGEKVRGQNVTGRLRAIWGTSQDNVWALGERGAYVTWNGSSWTGETRFTSGDIMATWGTDTAWVVGEYIGGSNLHRTYTNHTDWNLGSTYDLPREASAKLNTVSGSGGHVYVSGVPGTWEWNGEWTRLTTREMLQVYGLPGGAVATDSFNVWFFVGGEVIRTDAQPPDVSVSTSLLKAVWGTSSRDVWVAGTKGYLAHFDGAAWTRIPAVTTSDLKCIWGTSAGDIWAGGDEALLHYASP